MDISDLYFELKNNFEGKPLGSLPSKFNGERMINHHCLPVGQK